MCKRSILALACCLCAMESIVSSLEAGSTQVASPLEQNVDLLRVVVLDVSGSMDDDDTRGMSRLDTARREIQEALAQLPADKGTPVVLVPFSSKVWDDSEHVYTSTKDLKDRLAELKPKGPTNIAAGLSKAVERINQLGSAKNLVIYLYSDGEHNCGSQNLVTQQEENLDKLFGFRASKGLSQTVVVKRWGGVIAKLVAKLQKNPHVKVVDAGQLELRTVTLVPSAKLKAFEWRDAASSLARIQLDVTVTNRSGITLPEKTNMMLSCALPGCRWGTEPSMAVAGPVQAKSFDLFVKLEPQKLNAFKDYSLPLQFHCPSQVTTDKGLLLLVINPIQVSCALPAGQLRSQVSISAKLSKQGEPHWEDLNQCIAFWPMSLQIETETIPSMPWAESIKWCVRGLDGVKVTAKTPIVLQGGTRTVDVSLIKQVPVDQVIHGKTVKIQIELMTADKPKTLVLASMRVVLTVEIDLPATQITQIDQRISYVGRPQWADLTAGLVTVPVRLAIGVHGIMAPGTTVGLLPCKDVVRVDGTPVTIRSGQQMVDIVLTGKVDKASCLVKWPLRLKPPASQDRIRYLEPPPVTVSFVAPKPAQVVLGNETGFLTKCAYRGDEPEQATLGCGCLKLIGSHSPYATAGLRIKGLLLGQLGGGGFSKAEPDDWVSWSMLPTDTAAKVRLWHDVAVNGDLVVLPENSAPGVVLGSVIGMTVTYEALYKKIVLYLTVGLVAVLVGAILFWLARNMSPGLSSE